LPVYLRTMHYPFNAELQAENQLLKSPAAGTQWEFEGGFTDDSPISQLFSKSIRIRFFGIIWSIFLLKMRFLMAE